MTTQCEPTVSFSALWLLDADVDRDPLDLGDGGGDLEDLAVRDVAVGLEDDLAPILPDPVGHGLAGLLEGDRGPFAMPQEQLGSAPGPAGLSRVRNVADVSRPLLRAGRGHVDLLAAGHLHGEEHERHELEDDVDHRRHVDVLVAFVGSFAAEEHVVNRFHRGEVNTLPAIRGA